jgi:DNA-binding GntR family transcriptional regulator
MGFLRGEIGLMERRLKPIDFQVYNKPLHGIVLEILREAIVSGLLRPGEKLMEAQLAEEMGISRTPVREAIRKLELEGFVHMIPRKGACVAEYSEKDIVDTFRIRKALELLAIELAVEKITDAEIAELQKVLDEEAVSIENGHLEQIVDKDVEFHDVIYRATENERLISIMANLREQISRFRFVSLGGHGRGKDVLVEHGRLLEALRSRDLKLALEQTEEHIKNTQSALMAAIREKQLG